MKCVAKISDGDFVDIKRVTDEHAARLVSRGYVYIPKRIWKADVRDSKSRARKKIKKSSRQG